MQPSSGHSRAPTSLDGDLDRGSRKKRSKTFTGCWTCRSRHVKCDETKPNCRRCQAAKRQCGGYNHRFVWIAEHEHEHEHKQGPNEFDEDSIRRCSDRTEGKRLTGLTEYPTAHHPTITTVVLAAHLRELDTLAVAATPQSRGPFSVFSASRGVAVPEDRATPHPQQHEDTPDTIPWPVSEDGLVAAGRNRDGASPCRLPSDPERGTMAIFEHDSEDPAGISPQRPCQYNISKFHTVQPSLCTDPMPAQHRFLLHHWVTKLSSDMMAADGSDNMPRAVWVPLALAGLQSNPGGAGPSLSLFHSICSASAYHLDLLHNRHGAHLTTALRHKQLALQHLRHHLSAEWNGTKASSILMAILACLVVEAVSGTPHVWRTHLWAGLHVLRNASPDHDSSCPYFPKLLQVFLSIAAVCGLDLPEPMSAALLRRLPIDESYLNNRHGISHGTLRRILFANSMPLPRDKRDIPQANRAEWRLELLVPSVKNSWDSKVARTTKSEHVTNVFHLASLIFMWRRMGNEGFSSQMQTLVKCAVDCLDEVETTAESGSMMMWPIIVIAAECKDLDLQRRLLLLLARKNRFRSGHNDLLTDFIAAHWRRESDTIHIARGFDSSDLASSAIYDVPPI